MSDICTVKSIDNGYCVVSTKIMEEFRVSLPTDIDIDIGDTVEVDGTTIVSNVSTEWLQKQIRKDSIKFKVVKGVILIASLIAILYLILVVNMLRTSSNNINKILDNRLETLNELQNAGGSVNE